MPRASRSTRTRPGFRDRHGRGIRSSVTGPQLPPLRTRLDFFDACVSSAMEYVRDLWPEELAPVRVEVAAIPAGPAPTQGVDRWRVDRRARRIVLYRLAIERFAHLHKDDEWH